MHDRVAVLSVVSCLLQDLRYLRQHANTRLRGYSVPFLLAIRAELHGFNEDLGTLINRQGSAATGDPRPILNESQERR